MIERTTCVIPARFHGSQRLTGKPMREGPDGRTLLQTVHEAAQQVGFRRVVVATDDVTAAKIALGPGDRYVIETGRDACCGTQRAWEALGRQSLRDDFVVNWQVDEPGITPNMVKHLVGMTAAHGGPVGTLGAVAGPMYDRQTCVAVYASEPPKFALAWWRHPNENTAFVAEPLMRGVSVSVLAHIGIYCYSWAALSWMQNGYRRAALKACDPFQQLSLEQVIWGSLGLRTWVGPVTSAYEHRPIDTPEDLAAWQAGGFSLEPQEG